MNHSTYLCVLAAAIALAPLGSGLAQSLDENCVVSVLNRSARVQPDGTWRIENIPANFGPIRVRATCARNGITTSGQSDFINLETSIVNGFSPFDLGSATQIPTRLSVSSASALLGQIGGTTQITVTATYPDGSTANVSGTAGTNYTVSNPTVATIGPGGLLTALASGTVIVSASNEGAVGTTQLRVMLSGNDSDGDGIADDVEIANGLNPNDPVDAREDSDSDGLTNFEELITYGTNRLVADSDQDGISDGDEVRGRLGPATNPLLADSDGDGIRDLLEIQTGSDPNNGSSFNLAQALESFEVTPPTFVLTVNTIVGEASRQLSVIGHLKDGNTIDLTSTARGTTYTSSDLFVVNFGTPDGRVFAGQNGTATVTVANSSFSQQVAITVRSTSPAALSFVAIPGFANSVAVNGNYAYVAAGANGLQIVNVTNRLTPQVVGVFDTPGNANDVKVVGNLVYVADGTSGLRIINVANPAAPVSVGFVDTPGVAWDVAVAGTRIYIADGPNGLQVIDASIPSAPRIVGSLDTLGTAKGVDAIGNRAVIADGGTGLQVLDIGDPTRPNIIGSLSYIGGDARDVVLNGNFAFVADNNTSFTSIEITNPAQPVVRGSTPLSTGGRLQSVAVAGRFALGADVNFVNGVPIIDIGQPAVPTPRAILNFLGDFDGHGIAVDSSFVYLAAVSSSASTENGTTGTSRLFIGQYQSIEDTRGIPPQVSIMSPIAGTTVVEGDTITVGVQASDDVEVASVTLSANGTLIGSDSVAPYQYGFTVPTGVFALNLVAQAVDFGANNATSALVQVLVVPDPRTTVRGRVVNANGNAVAGAQVSAFDGLPATTAPDGTFSLASVSTIRGNIVVNASATVGGVLLSGSSTSTAPVRGGVTDVGTITVIEANFETQYGASLASCDDCWVEVDLPFAFTFFGITYQRVFFDGNGRVSFGFGSGSFTESIPGLAQQPIVSALWNDWDASGIQGSGIYYNGGLPGRAVFTWLNIPTFPSNPSKPRVTFQIILFQDGRVQFGYNGITVGEGVTGISAGPASTQQIVNFSAQPSFSFSGPRTVAQQFAGTFNLDRRFITWTPNATAGYDVRVFGPQAAPSPASSAITAPEPVASSKYPMIKFHSRIGRIYLLQVNSTADFTEPNWQTIREPFVGTGGEMVVILPSFAANPGAPHYRVIPVGGTPASPSDLAEEQEWIRSLRLEPQPVGAAASPGGTAVSSASPAQGGMRLQFRSAHGFRYRIESCEDLAAGEWTVCSEEILGTGAVISIVDPASGSLSQCFYRVVRFGPTAP